MAIQIKNLRKSFSGKEILKGIDFTFEQGKINMIIGASGSGKSVMLKCIVGLMKPSDGTVLYDGMDFHRANHKDVRSFRKNMGMLFQYSALFDSMTVAENIAFPLKLFTKYSPKAINSRVRFCLERVNMAGTDSAYPAELSGGMMKRVGIARAIALNPKYLFVDEPNSGLDPLTASVVDELIKELTYEYNMCTVVVSHDMNSVVNISDKIMFLHHGVKAWEGDKQSILRSGNPDLDRFVFVSELIRRDLYDDSEDAKALEEFGGRKPIQVDRKELEMAREAAAQETENAELEPFSVEKETSDTKDKDKDKDKETGGEEGEGAESVTIETAVEESKDEVKKEMDAVVAEVKAAAIDSAVGKVDEGTESGEVEPKKGPAEEIKTEAEAKVEPVAEVAKEKQAVSAPAEEDAAGEAEPKPEAKTAPARKTKSKSGKKNKKSAKKRKLHPADRGRVGKKKK